METQTKNNKRVLSELIDIIDKEDNNKDLIPVEKLFATNNLPTGRPHISYSELHDWIECNWRHKIKYIDNIKTDTESIHTIYGQMIHSAIETYLVDRAKLIDVELFKNKWHNEIIPQFKQKSIDNEEFAKAYSDYEKSKAEFDDSIEPILKYIPEWLDVMFPGWVTYGAEIKLYEAAGKNIDLNNPDTNKFFKGFIDCVLQVGNPKKKGEFTYYIIDWKTTSWGWAFEKKTSFNKQLQLVLYKHFFSKKYNIPLKDIKCGFVLIKRKPPKSKTGEPAEYCEYVNVSVGPKTEARALEYVDRMFGHLKKGLYPKNRQSCKYCAYKDTEHCT